jgi:hypothetical protein
MSCGAVPTYRAVQKSDAFISNHPFRDGVRRHASACGQAAPWPEAPQDYRFQRENAKRRKLRAAFTARARAVSKPDPFYLSTGSPSTEYHRTRKRRLRAETGHFLATHWHNA